MSRRSLWFSCRDELDKIKLPRNLDDAKALCSVLVNYKDDYVVPVVGIFIATYVL